MNKTNEISTHAIGVFDSGLGGISVLKELVELMPNENYIYYGDSCYAPYGTKNKEEIIERCITICDYLISKEVKAIVIACNTATSAAVNVLRDKYKPLPIIGMEPALKPAANDKKNNNIVVMATNLTLNEEKFNNLMKKYSDSNNIIKMPCPELVDIVENDMLNDTVLIEKTLKKYYSDIEISTLDSVVLGCTHFVFFKEHLSKMLDKKTNIIDGNNGTAKHLKEVLEQNGKLNNTNCAVNDEKVILLNSHKDVKYIELSKILFNFQ